MTEIKVGDKVRMSAAGRHKYDDRPANPHSRVGEVTRVKSDLSWYPYTVIWDDNEYLENQYEVGEIELVEEKETTIMFNVPFNISGGTIAVYFNGKMYQVPESDDRYEALRDHLKSGAHDYDILEDILDVPTKLTRVTAGLVEVEDGTVTYKGEPVAGPLVTQLLRLMADGWDVTPWAKFLDNLMKNPSYRSRTQLYGFIEKHGAPLTEDGCFIAFKGVRWNYTDHHTGKFDNSIGQTVVMDRTQVDDDPNNTCSSGLHVCATEYLSGGMFSGERIVICKVNPRDVVSIPSDYGLSKMRVCRYEVIAEVEKQDLDSIWDQKVYS